MEIEVENKVEIEVENKVDIEGKIDVKVEEEVEGHTGYFSISDKSKKTVKKEILNVRLFFTLYVLHKIKKIFEVLYFHS